MYVPPQAISCQCDHCCENQCSLDLAGIKSQVAVVELNGVRKITRASGNIADCAIIWKNEDVFAIVELKGGQIASPKAVDQIQGAVNVMMDLFKKQTVKQLYPILLYNGKDPTNTFANERIDFNHEKRRIILAECGTRLETILNQIKKNRRRNRRR